MTIRDQTSDPGFATMRVLLERYDGLLEFTKTAEMSPSAFEELPDSAFAWPEARSFPIHTPEHAALSLAYAKHAGAQLPGEVAVKLAQAAAIHGVPQELLAEEKVAAAPTEEDYLLPDQKRFLVKTASDVQLAESIFFEKIAQIPVGDRAIMARNMVAAAEKHGVELHPSTYKYACLTMTSTQVFKDWMRARTEAAEKVGAAPQAQAFQKLAAAFPHPTHLSEPKEQFKLASCVHQLDSQAGLDKHYDRTLPDPLSTVFNTSHRRENFVKIGSVLQNKALVQSVPLEFWEDALGPDITKEIAPNGEVDLATLEQILPTLPADMKNAVETQLAAYNQ